MSIMLLLRQREIIDLLKEQPFLPSGELREKMGVSRERLNQLISPLLKQSLVMVEGKARATVYRLTGKKDNSLIIKENWELLLRVRELEKDLEDRKIIERAKEILIAQFNILPTEAYRKLQEQSMDRGRPLREVAESILLAYEL